MALMLLHAGRAHQKEAVAVDVGAVAVRRRRLLPAAAEALAVELVRLHALAVVARHVGRGEAVVKHKQLAVPHLAALLLQEALHATLQRVHLGEALLAQLGREHVAPDAARAVHQNGRVPGHVVQGLAGRLQVRVPEALVGGPLRPEEVPGVPLVVVAHVQHHVPLAALQVRAQALPPLLRRHLLRALLRVGQVAQALGATLEGDEAGLVPKREARELVLGDREDGELAAAEPGVAPRHPLRVLHGLIAEPAQLSVDALLADVDASRAVAVGHEGQVFLHQRVRIGYIY
mmetsp:Transcript_48193/g.89769  ORF Transcript_48193/g.89769 Transcript_48193/m.89769 type:complete len:289 (+) Transcript_48193:1138-2004(+)